MKQIIRHINVGISSGVFIGLMVSFLISWQVGEGKFYPSTPFFMSKFDTELEALGWSIVLWSLIGIMFSFASLIYEKNNWSIVKQAVIHFMCTYLGLLFLNVLLNWFSYTLKDVIRFTVVFIAIYLTVVMISMFKVRLSLKEINQQLEVKGSEQNDPSDSDKSTK